MLIRFFYIFLLFFLCSCGYTTKVPTLYQNEKIYINPVKNKISITAENRRYSDYRSYPILLEKRLTGAIINRLNVDRIFKVVSTKEDCLELECEILDYKKEALRYLDNDQIKEQRIRLYVNVKLKDKDNNVLKEKNIIGETSFFLLGPQKKSETLAQQDLIEDTARRIVEFIAEEW